jgi:hypothetical protein
MADADVAVGDAVLVNNKHRGIVRYIGSTSFADGTWFGLELEREIGKWYRCGRAWWQVRNGRRVPLS